MSLANPTEESVSTINPSLTNDASDKITRALELPVSRRNFLQLTAGAAGAAALNSTVRTINYAAQNPAEVIHAATGEAARIVLENGGDAFLVEQLDPETLGDYVEAPLTYVNISGQEGMAEHQRYFVSEPGTIPELNFDYLSHAYSAEIDAEVEKSQGKYTRDEIVRKYGEYIFNKLIDEQKMHICYKEGDDYFAGARGAIEESALFDLGSFGHLSNQVVVENGQIASDFKKSKPAKLEMLNEAVGLAGAEDGLVTVLTCKTRFGLPNEIVDANEPQRQNMYKDMGLDYQPREAWKDKDWKFLYNVHDPEVKKLFNLE